MQTVITKELFKHHLAFARIPALSIAAMLLLLSLPALAESAKLSCREKPKDEAQATTAASDLFARGERAFAAQEYLKALKRFLCSLNTFEHEATLTNIKEIVKFVDPKAHAAKLLDEYVALNPTGKLTPQLAEIAAAVKNGMDVDQVGEEKEIEPVPPPPPVESPPIQKCVFVKDSTPYIRHAEDENLWFKRLGAVTLGTGAALVITGAVLQGISIGAGNDGDIEKKKQFQTGAIVGFVGGAVAVGIGAAQFVLALKKQKQLQRLKSAPAIVEQCDSEQKAEARPKVKARLDVGFGTALLMVHF